MESSNPQRIDSPLGKCPPLNLVSAPEFYMWVFAMADPTVVRALVTVKGAEAPSVMD